jgi:thiol-disulfide isomerase/thioredoxin
MTPTTRLSSRAAIAHGRQVPVRSARTLPWTIAAMCGLLFACQPRATTSPTPIPAAKAATGDQPEDDAGEGYAAATRDAMVGRPAPAVTLTLLDGTRVALAELIGRKPVYLKFWATWCKPCREQMPHLEAAHRNYGDQIAMYAVDLGLNDPIETVRAFQAEHALAVPIAVDGDGGLAERFKVVVTPMHVLIDRAGVVRYVGHLANAGLDAALASLLDNGLGKGAESAAPASRNEAPATPGSARPTLRLKLRNGSTFTLGEHTDKPVALSFVSAWCDWYLADTRPAMAGSCIAHARLVAGLRRSHADVTWITVAHPLWTAHSDLDGYAQKFDADMTIGIDDGAQWFLHFGVRDVPITILLDARGAEIARSGGQGEALVEALARLR